VGEGREEQEAYRSGDPAESPLPGRRGAACSLASGPRRRTLAVVAHLWMDRDGVALGGSRPYLPIGSLGFNPKWTHSHLRPAQ